MTAWKAIEQAEPAFAEHVRKLFEAGRHKTIATLRADGGPRISGIECEFVDGELRFGSMTGARKGADLHRDPRFALHGPTFHPVEGKEGDWPGEAKIAGRAVPAGPVPTGDTGDTGEPQPDGEMFVADINEVVVTGLNPEATKLVVQSWTPERGLRTVERDRDAGGPMRIVIEGRNLPGSKFVSEGVPLHNVHVAVQIGAEPVGLVRGDADRARWEIDVRTVMVDGQVDLRGPAVHGKRGERFLYLTWGDVGANHSFAMFRRAKLMFNDIEPELLAAAAVGDDGVLVASLPLTDDAGCPRCARVKPPVIAWRRGTSS